MGCSPDIVRMMFNVSVSAGVVVYKAPQQHFIRVTSDVHMWCRGSSLSHETHAWICSKAGLKQAGTGALRNGWGHSSFTPLSSPFGISNCTFPTLLHLCPLALGPVLIRGQGREPESTRAGQRIHPAAEWMRNTWAAFAQKQRREAEASNGKKT